MTGPTTRIERITYRAGDVVPPCEAADRSHCRAVDFATYRIERIDPESGIVWRRQFCLGAAAAWAQRHQAPFPTIAPADLMDYLDERRDVARIASGQ